MLCGPQAEAFGRILIENLRDRAILHYEQLASGHLKAPSLAAIQNELHSLSPSQRDLIRRCIIMAVDAGLHDFLFSIEEAHDIDQGLTITANGADIVEQSDGLHGELCSDKGWIAKYSRYPSSQTEA